MKPFSVLLFTAMASACAVPKLGKRQETVAECCYTYDNGSYTARFRTNTLTAIATDEPYGHCQANISRDPNDPNNCAAADAKTYSGYCKETGVALTPVACT